jgi:hypothetical protein
LGHEYEAVQLFAGVCCAHLPLAAGESGGHPGAGSDPAPPHWIFFDDGHDPALMRLQLWALRPHLIAHGGVPSLCAVLDGCAYQIDHTCCKLMETFSGGRAPPKLGLGPGPRSMEAPEVAEAQDPPPLPPPTLTPPFTRMTFEDCALQLWYPPAEGTQLLLQQQAEVENGAGGDCGGVVVAAAAAAAVRVAGGVAAVAAVAIEEDEQRLQELVRRMGEAVARQPFRPARATARGRCGSGGGRAAGIGGGGSGGAAGRGVAAAAAAGAGRETALATLRARCEAADSARGAVVSALRALVASARPAAESGRSDGGGRAGAAVAAPGRPRQEGAEDRETGDDPRKRRRRLMRSLNEAVAAQAAVALSPREEEQATAHVTRMQAAAQFDYELQLSTPPPWPASSEGHDEDEHGDAAQWRQEELFKIAFDLVRRRPA